MPERRIIGLMSGTSCDGIDAVLARVIGQGLTQQVRILEQTSLPLGDLGVRLRNAANQAALSAEHFTRLSAELALACARCVQQMVSWRQAHFVVAHGQTVFHRPPLSWQLINLPLLSSRLGIPVLGDLRAGDLAAGGQGAPITPLADRIIFGHAQEHRLIVNLGGFCNRTLLIADNGPISGGDVCVCNQLLDSLARRLLGQAYDVGGARAARGIPQARVVEAVQAELREARLSGRSLGTGDEELACLGAMLGNYAADDVLASVAQAIASEVLAGVSLPDARPVRVILAGGGTYNLALARAMSQKANARGWSCDSAEHCGVAPSAREALAMAVLGALCHDGVPITLPSVTGCPDPAPLGGVWAGLRCVSLN